MMAVTPPVRVGIASLAMYHGTFWARALAASEKAELVGIWDDDAGRGREGARAAGTRYVPELERLLDACDAICITSETVRHADLVERAAAAGRHVLCEKPLATTMADCDRIRRAVDAAGITFMQGYPKRFDPASHELKRLVDGGELGTVTLVRVRHGHLYGLRRPDVLPGWMHDPLQAGGGALLDEGCHGADLIRWLFGEPDAVMATVSHRALGRVVEDLGLAVFLYDDGPACELCSSVTFAAGDASVEIFGTRGTAILSGVDLASRDVTDGGFLRLCVLDPGAIENPATRSWQVVPVTPGFQDTPAFHQQSPLRFVDALVRGAPPPVTIEDGRRSLQMILSAYEAARTGTTVRIPGPDRATPA